MAKIVLSVCILLQVVFGSVYENNCVACHNNLPVSIDKYFYRYLLKYSSERNVKNAMARYLKAPKKENSIMAEAFIRRFGVKKPTTLNNDDLKKALDTYWEKYKIFGKLQ